MFGIILSIKYSLFDKLLLSFSYQLYSKLCVVSDMLHLELFIYQHVKKCLNLKKMHTLFDYIFRLLILSIFIIGLNCYSINHM